MPRAPRLLFMAALAVLVVAGAVPARASTITDTFDPTDQYFSKNGGTCTGINGSSDSITGQVDVTNNQVTLASCDTLSFLQDISSLYTTPPDLTAATLDLYFYDNSDPGGGNPEEVRVTVELGSSGSVDQTITSGSSSSSADQFTFDVLTYLSDGQLNVFLQRGDYGGGQNDFYFARAVLNAEWPGGDDVTPTPEPASLLLFGSGLSALAFRMRRRKKSSES